MIVDVIEGLLIVFLLWRNWVLSRRWETQNQINSLTRECLTETGMQNEYLSEIAEILRRKEAEI